MKRDDLMRRMHRAGLRLDDAATAAAVAVQAHQRERNLLIVSARSIGLSLRQIGGMFGLSQVQAMRVLRKHTGGVTPSAGTVQAPEKELQA